MKRTEARMAGLRRVVAGVLAWIAGAVAAAAVGTLALSLIGDALVDRALPPSLTVEQDVSPSPLPSPSVAPSPSPSPSPSRSPSPSPSGVPSRSPSPSNAGHVLSTPAGSVIARCTPGGAYLESWSPAQGFRVDDVWRGPADVARVVFERWDHHEVVYVRCVNGTPQAFYHWTDPR